MKRKEKFERRETILGETYLINCRNGWYGKNRNGGILREKRKINLPPQPARYIKLLLVDFVFLSMFSFYQFRQMIY